MLAIYEKTTHQDIITSLQNQYEIISEGLQSKITDLETAVIKIEEIDLFIGKVKASDHISNIKIAAILNNSQHFPLRVINKIIYPTINSLSETPFMSFSKQLFITKQTKNTVNTSDLEALSKMQKNLKTLAEYFNKHAFVNSPNYFQCKQFLNDLNDFISKKITENLSPAERVYLIPNKSISLPNTPTQRTFFTQSKKNNFSSSLDFTPLLDKEDGPELATYSNNETEESLLIDFQTNASDISMSS